MNYTCGVFVVSSDDKLLVCHPTGASNYGNVWSIPKGLPDPEDESHCHTAARELMEETGIEISCDAFTPLNKVQYKTKSKTLVPFLVKTKRSSTEIVPACHSYFERNDCLHPEIDKFEWVSFDSAKLMLHESQAQLVDTVRKIIQHNSSK